MVRPKTTDVRKIVSFPAALAASVKEFRFSHEIGTESEAIRQLIEKGLEVAKTEGRIEDGAQA